MCDKALILSLNYDSCSWIIDKINNVDNLSVELIELKKSLEAFQSNEYKSLIVNYKEMDNNIYNNDENIDLNELKINYSERKVYINSEEVKLTPKEFYILYMLASNKGVIFSKEEIYEGVWKSEYASDDSNIMAHIRKLRKKIESDPKNPKYIVTVWGVGYKFNG